MKPNLDKLLNNCWASRERWFPRLMTRAELAQQEEEEALESLSRPIWANRENTPHSAQVARIIKISALHP